MNWQRDDYFISTDKELLDFPLIFRFITEEAYWGQGRSEQTMRTAIAHSTFCFGLYRQLQDERVQAQLAQQILQISLQSQQQQQGGPSVEQQMVELNKAELQLSQQRIQSQDTREAAKLALKQQELGLKRQQMEMLAADKQRQAQINASAKILDNQAKMSQIAQKELSARVANPG